MATVLITPDQDTVIAEIEIAAPPERVFRAIVDPAEMKRWGSNEAFEITAWEMDPRPGGRWRFVSKERNPKTPPAVSEFQHHGEVLEIDPPRVLAYTWFANWHEQPKRQTVVRWELTPTPTGTKVKVTHSGLAQEAKARRDYSSGWPGLLERLKKHSEK